jgi:hypothetical protein
MEINSGGNQNSQIIILMTIPLLSYGTICFREVLYVGGVRDDVEIEHLAKSLSSLRARNT